MKSAIMSEILKVTGEKPQAGGEADQKFLARLVRATSDLKDKEFNKLSKEAQAWNNAAVDQLEAKKDVAAFPDLETGDGNGDEKKDKPSGRRQVSKDTSSDDDGDSKDKKSTTDKKSGGDKEKKEPAEKKGRGTDFYRKLLIEHPKWDREKLLSSTQEKGFKISKATADFTHNETTRTLEVLREKGMLKED